MSIGPSAGPEPLYDEVTVWYREHTSPVWDMSQERVFFETMLNQRFNFFLVFFSFVLAGSLNVKSQLGFRLLLSLGATVSIMFASVLRRSQEKLDLILAELRRDQTHPVRVINDKANSRGSRRRLIGVYIPAFCCIVLIVAAVAAWVGWQHVAM